MLVDNDDDDAVIVDKETDNEVDFLGVEVEKEKEEKKEEKKQEEIKQEEIKQEENNDNSNNNDNNNDYNNNNNDDDDKPILNYRDKQRLWVKSANSGKWRECVIIKEKRNKVKVHFLSFHRKYDEWLLTSSDRVSQTKPELQIEDGDVISVYSNKMKQWIIAEVSSIKIKTNRVQITLIGTEKQVWLQIDDPRLSVSIKEPDDPFNGNIADDSI